MQDVTVRAQQFSSAAQGVLHRSLNRPRLIICELFADQLSNLNAILMRTVLIRLVGLVEVECREDKGQKQAQQQSRQCLDIGKTRTR